MKKIHVAAVALLLALAVVLGAAAAVRTTGLGSSARATNDAAVREQSRRLDVFEASLRRRLAQAGTRTPAPRVVYHRPPPVVVSTAHDDEHDGDHEENEHDD